jgi:hypothetical protein
MAKKKKTDEHILRHIIRHNHCPDWRRLLDGDIDHLRELLECRPGPIVTDVLNDIMAMTIQPRPIC